jgi:hypothetical protein
MSKNAYHFRDLTKMIRFTQFQFVMSSISRSSESSSIIVSFQGNESKNEKKYFDLYLPCAK